MNLYLIEQRDNVGYDTYDACIVCAESEEDARSISPDELHSFGETYTSWALSRESVTCKELGKANADQVRGIILASFNAG